VKALVLYRCVKVLDGMNWNCVNIRKRWMEWAGVKWMCESVGWNYLGFRQCVKVLDGMGWSCDSVWKRWIVWVGIDFSHSLLFDILVFFFPWKQWFPISWKFSQDHRSVTRRVVDIKKGWEISTDTEIVWSRNGECEIG